MSGSCYFDQFCDAPVLSYFVCGAPLHFVQQWCDRKELLREALFGGSTLLMCFSVIAGGLLCSSNASARAFYCFYQWPPVCCLKTSMCYRQNYQAVASNCTTSSLKSSGLYTTVMYREHDGQRAISSPAASSCCDGAHAICHSAAASNPPES